MVKLRKGRRAFKSAMCDFHFGSLVGSTPANSQRVLPIPILDDGIASLCALSLRYVKRCISSVSQSRSVETSAKSLNCASLDFRAISDSFSNVISVLLVTVEPSSSFRVSNSSQPSSLRCSNGPTGLRCRAKRCEIQISSLPIASITLSASMCQYRSKNRPVCWRKTPPVAYDLTRAPIGALVRSYGCC